MEMRDFCSSHIITTEKHTSEEIMSIIELDSTNHTSIIQNKNIQNMKDDINKKIWNQHEAIFLWLNRAEHKMDNTFLVPNKTIVSDLPIRTVDVLNGDIIEFLDEHNVSIVNDIAKDIRNISDILNLKLVLNLEYEYYWLRQNNGPPISSPRLPGSKYIATNMWTHIQVHLKKILNIKEISTPVLYHCSDYHSNIKVL